MKSSSMLTRDEVAEVCPECAANMKKRGITKVSRSVVAKKLAAKKEAEIQNHLADGTTLVLDFHADWCKQCAQVQPEVNKIADKLNSGAVFVAVDVDELPQLASRFRVKQLPVVALFKQGSEIKRWGSNVTAVEVLKAARA